MYAYAESPSRLKQLGVQKALVNNPNKRTQRTDIQLSL